MRAVIMAGGQGTRLSSIATDIPKPMFPIIGKPILEYQIESLAKSGIENITLVVGHLSEVIIKYFGDGQKFGVNIRYIVENEPLGTAGALYYLKDETEDFVLIFGDLILDIDFNRFMKFHKKHGAAITLFGHPNSHPYDSDVIVMNDESIVTAILSKKLKRDFFYHNFVNAGLYCVNPQVLSSIKKPEKIDLEKTLIANLINQRQVFAYKSTEYVKDMGTPDRLEAVAADVKNGVVVGRSLKEKQKAIFWRRDKIINEYEGVFGDVNNLKLLPAVAESIAKINGSAYLTIVVGDQPKIMRNEVTYQEIEDVHKKMETELGKQGAYIDDIFFCTHYSNKDYDEEEEKLKIHCDWQKLKMEIFKEASDRYNIDLSQSWYITDTAMDIHTGNNVGMKTLLLRGGGMRNDDNYDAEPDYAAENLDDAITYILNG